MNKELVGVQYLRGLAAVAVVIHHLFTTGPLDRLFIPWLGGYGVDVFFVISGFIMWHTTVDTNATLADFWQRRFIRIVPLYWMFLTLLIIVSFASPNSLHSTVLDLESTILSFLFIPHMHPTQN